MSEGEPNNPPVHGVARPHELPRFDRSARQGAKSRETAKPRRSGQALCLSCGLCCSGAIFSYVPLEDDAERERAEALGLRTKVAARSTFDQPCTALSDLRCTIYSERPRACQKFRCNVLRRFVDEEISEQDAAALVARARSFHERYLTEASKFDDDARSKSVSALESEFLKRWTDATTYDEKRQYTQVLLYIRVMIETVANHFWKGAKLEG